MFPEVEVGYEKKLQEFEINVQKYCQPSFGVLWEIKDGLPVHVGLDKASIDRSFFDWNLVPTDVREVIAAYYIKNYPAYNVDADPETLNYFFAGSEFHFFVGSDLTDPSGEREIRAFSLGAWPQFRNLLIEKYPAEAANLASAVYYETASDWKPVGNRSEMDPLKFLRKLQSGKSVRRHANFTLFRLQRKSMD
jgi:hypothetical protein